MLCRRPAIGTVAHPALDRRHVCRKCLAWLQSLKSIEALDFKPYGGTQ
jgi:hypothetical protein